MAKQPQKKMTNKVVPNPKSTTIYVGEGAPRRATPRPGSVLENAITETRKMNKNPKMKAKDMSFGEGYSSTTPSSRRYKK